MKLIFLRHGLSEGHFSPDPGIDFMRKLTKEGRKKLHKTFKKFLKYEKKVDVIFSSPLLRSIETAEILWSYYKSSNLELMGDLDILDDPDHLVEYISLLPADGVYVFVGHDPHLTEVISSILSLHPEHEFMKIKKGGICIVEGRMWSGFRLTSLLNF